MSSARSEHGGERRIGTRVAGARGKHPSWMANQVVGHRCVVSAQVTPCAAPPAPVGTSSRYSILRTGLSGSPSSMIARICRTGNASAPGWMRWSTDTAVSRSMIAPTSPDVFGSGSIDGSDVDAREQVDRHRRLIATYARQLGRLRDADACQLARCHRHEPRRDRLMGGSRGCLRPECDALVLMPGPHHERLDQLITLQHVTEVTDPCSTVDRPDRLEHHRERVVQQELGTDRQASGCERGLDGIEGRDASVRERP